MGHLGRAPQVYCYLQRRYASLELNQLSHALDFALLPLQQLRPSARMFDWSVSYTFRICGGKDKLLFPQDMKTEGHDGQLSLSGGFIGRHLTNDMCLPSTTLSQYSLEAFTIETTILPPPLEKRIPLLATHQFAPCPHF